MSSVAMPGVQDAFTPSEDSLVLQGYASEANDPLESEVMRDEKYRTRAPYEIASPLGSKYSSEYSQDESTSATQGSSRALSEVELDEIGRYFLGFRMKKFMEATRPGLILSDGKFDLLLAAHHADHLLLALDDAVRQLVEANQKLSGMKEMAKPKMKLLEDWVFVLIQAISALDFPKGQKEFVKQFAKEHLCGRLEVLSVDLNQICRLLMTFSVNTRVADLLLLDLIKKHGDKFDGKGIEDSLNYQKIKPISTRFHRLPTLPSPRIPGSRSSDINLTIQWTHADDGLLIKDMETVGLAEFASLPYKHKLNLINAFFKDIRIHVIESAFVILNENTQILAPFRSFSKKFGQQMSLAMKPTSNGLEKHILEINAILDGSDATYWDKTLGHVIIQYLIDIRQRLLQVIDLTDLTNQGLHKFQDSIQKIDDDIGSVLAGKWKGKQYPGEQVSVDFRVSEDFGNFLTSSYLIRHEQGTSESLLEDEDGVPVSIISSQKESEVKISISDHGSHPALSRWGKFKGWFTWKKTGTA